MSAPVGPCWAQPSWRDDVWGPDTWGAAQQHVSPPPDEERIGAGSSNGHGGGLELYVSMRAAEAQRKGESKPIESLVAPVEERPLFVVPAVVVPPRSVRAVEPVELGPENKQESITRLQSAIPAEAPDYGPSLVPDLVEVEKEPYDDEAIDAIRARRQAASDRDEHIRSLRAELFAPSEQSTERSPVAYAAQLAQASRLAIEEEELAYVLLIAA